MPELKGYKAQTPRTSIGSTSNRAATASISEASRGTQSLLQKLERMSALQLQNAKAEATDKARKDAFTDARNGEAIPSQSVTTAYGRAYNEVATATWSAKAEMDISEKSQEFALQYENDPAGYVGAMKPYSESLSEQAPNAELASVTAITGDKYIAKTFGKLKVAEKRRFDRDAIETFDQSWELNVNQIIEQNITGTPRDAETLRMKNIDYINAMERDGLIDSATKQKYLKDGQYKVTYGTSMREMENLLEEDDLTNASTYLEETTKTNREDMDTQENDAYRAGLNSLYSAELRKRKATESKKSDFSNFNMKEQIELVKNGQAHNPAVVDASFSGSSASNKAEYLKQIEVSKILNTHANKSLPEQQLVFQGMDTLYEEGKLSGIDLDARNTFKQRLQERENKAKRDVVGLAINEGKIKEPPPMNAENGVDALLGGLDIMEDNSYIIKSEYGETYTNILREDDAQSWSDYVNSTSIPNVNKLEVIQSIYANNPAVAKAVFRQIGGKNAGTFEFVARLAEHGSERVALLTLAGKGSKIDLDPTFKSGLNSSFENVFAGYDAKDFNQFLEGTTSYAKGYKQETGDDISSTDAIKATMGEIKSYNEKSVVLPLNTTQTDFEYWLDTMEIPENENLQEAIRDMTDTFGSGNIQFYYAGQNKYRVMDNTNGNLTIVADPKEPTKPFILEWK